MTKNRAASFALAFALAPVSLFTAGTAKADAPTNQFLPTGEPLVWMDNCPFDARRPHAMRCMSRRLVPQSYAEARKIGPFTPGPDAGEGVDSGAAWCDGQSSGGFGFGPSGLAPSDYVKAYSIPASPTGAGKVVAIVDGCANSTVVSDLAAYRSNYALGTLPECGGGPGHAPVPGGTACFGVVSQRGDSGLPPPDSGWAGEIALDVEMVSAACPDCSILLVEADSPNSWDLGLAVNEAVTLGASAVSNSYGGIEDPHDPLGPPFSDGTYETYYQHDGVLITVASGDWGYENDQWGAAGYPYPGGTAYLAPSFPSTIPSVLSIGGTDLTASGGTGRGYTEQVWSGTTSGCSTEFAKPAYQTGVSMGSCTTGRGDVDVAAPAQGVAMYVGGAWAPGGASGTSCASPFVAGLFTRLGLANQPNAFFYTHHSAFYDVTTGNNEGSTTCADMMCKGAVGWDGPTGWGSPNATALLATEADAGTGEDAGVDAGPHDAGTDAGQTADAGHDAGHDAGEADSGEAKDATTTDATAENDASGGTDATLGNDAAGSDDSGSGSGSGGGSGSGSGSGGGSGSGSGSGGGSGSGSGGGSGGGSGSSSGGGSEDSGPIATGDNENGNGASGNSGGCGCVTAGSSSPQAPGGLAMIALGALVVARRRRRR